MRLKDGLVLREVAGQYVIVPTGKRALEIPGIHYMTGDAAMLWNAVYGKEFEKKELIEILREKYPQVSEERLEQSAESFIEGVSSRWLLHKENGGVESVYYSVPENK